MKSNLIIYGLLLVSLFLLGSLLVNSLTTFSEPVTATFMQNWYIELIRSHVGPLVVVQVLLLIAVYFKYRSERDR